MSCSGNGYLTERQLVAFPFEDGQFCSWDESVDALTAQTALQKCFVDAGINLNLSSIPDGGWPSIGAFSYSGSTISFVLRVAGIESAMSVSASTTTFPIVQGSASWGWYSLILSSEGIREFCESEFISYVSENADTRKTLYSWLKLCPKCIAQKPDELTSIRVYDGVNSRSTGPHFVLTGDVSVKPGNNMQFSEPDDESGFKLEAVPGAGWGVIPCTCTTTADVKSLLIGKDGHSRFFNDTCYDLEPSIVVNDGKREGHLQIHVKCTACCTCSMYESLVNDRLVPLSDAIRKAHADLNGYLSTYEDAVRRFNNRLAKPTLSDVTLSLTGMSVGKNVGSKLSGSSIKGKMGRCAYTAVLRNDSYATLTARIYMLTGTDTVVEASVSWSDDDGNPKTKSADTASGLIGSSFTVYPGRSLAVTFVSRRDRMVNTVTTKGYSGTISIGVSYRTDGGLSGSLGILKRTVEV